MSFENLHEGMGAAHFDFDIGDPAARLIAEIVSYQAQYRVEYDEISIISATLNAFEIKCRVRVISTEDIFEFKLSLG